MTKKQIEMLRCLIQGEIEAAFQNKDGCKWAFEQESENDENWESFINSFVKTEEVFEEECDV
jgi:hypothetical protein